MDPHHGFPPGVRYTPVPNPLLGSLLQEIETLAELKCTLRALVLIQQRRGQRLWITEAELLSDTVLLGGLVHETGDAREAIRKGLRSAAERGTLLKVDKDSEALLFINDEPGRRASAAITKAPLPLLSEEHPGSGPLPEKRSSIFMLYEDNIGIISPILAEKLGEAEQRYPWSWLDEAIVIAVEHNKRRWAYIESILERWATEGKDDGKSGRRTQTTDPEEYQRRYGHLARGRHAGE